MIKYSLARKSGNKKTGPIPVSMTSRSSCPPACPLIGAGCYADGWPLNQHWAAVDVDRGLTLPEFASALATIPAGSLWRHNQAGDLPGSGNQIDRASLRTIAHAARHARGFSYTHYPLSANNADAIIEAREFGLTINASANNAAHADQLADLGVAPVVTIAPVDARENFRTPAGRLAVI